jgi:Putative RNA methylase family UPF0020
MAGYALLLLPSANRVYTDSASGLARAELDVFSRSVLDGSIGQIAQTTIGGAGYITFEAGDLDDDALAFLSNLSSGYALFERRGDLLRPVGLRPAGRYDDDLITIQKYQGKTNEQFTKLLLNVTVLSSASAAGLLTRKLAVLDPLCGRGTTLNQALMYGYDAAGIDLDRQDFDAYRAFIRTWLQRKRLKHRVEYDGPVRRNGKTAARRLRIELAPARDAWRAGATQTLDVVSADTVRAAEFFRPASADVLVTDAPYGVQHGSRTAARGLARDPLDLLGQAGPVWASLLRPGGAVGVGWNTLVARREEAAEALAGAGLEPLSSPPYLEFRHRVDQSIVRDIIVARKPG